MSIIPYASAELWQRRVCSLSLTITCSSTGAHVGLCLAFWSIGVDLVVRDELADRR